MVRNKPIHPDIDTDSEHSVRMDNAKQIPRNKSEKEEEKITEPLAHQPPDQSAENHHAHKFNAFPHLEYVEKRPCCSTCIGCSVFGALLILLVGLLAGGVNVITFSTEVPMYLRDHESYIGYTALLQAESTANSQLNEDDSEDLERSSSLFPLEIIYVLNDNNEDTLLTADFLTAIKEFEEEIAFNAEYVDYCALTYTYDANNPSCVRHTTPINYFDTEWWLPATTTIPNPTSPSAMNLYYAYNSKLWAVSNISYVFANPQDPDYESDTLSLDSDTIDTIAEYWGTYCSEAPCGSEANPDSPYAYLFPSSGNSTTNLNASNYFWAVSDASYGLQDDLSVGENAVALKSIFYFGGPLKKSDGTLYETEGDDYDTMESKVGNWLYSEFQSYLSTGIDGIKVHWDGKENGMFSVHIQTWLAKDGALAIGTSFCFVFLYLMLMLRSFMLAVFGMGMILANFIPAILLYRGIAGFEYFGTLNMLGIFIILGIGADDLFVFMDTWTATKAQYPNMPHHQKLSHTLGHAGKAMLTTSLSTALSFLANTTSSFPAVYTFGAFCFFLVLCNFCSVCILWPCIVTAYEYYFKGGDSFLCLDNNCCCLSCLCKNKKKDKWGYKTASNEEETPEEPGGIEVFFRDRYYPLLHKLRYPILVFFFCLAVIYIAFSAGLQPDPDPPAFLPDSDNYMSFTDTKMEYFGSREVTIGKLVVKIPLGIDYLDQSECDGRTCDPTIPSDYGTIYWNEDIEDMRTEFGQKLILDFCEDMEFGTDEGVSAADRYVYEADVYLDNPVRCMMTSFKLWCEYNDCPKTAHLESGSRLLEDDYIVDEDDFTIYLTQFLNDDQMPNDAGYVAGQTNYDVWGDYIYAEDVYSVKVFRFVMVQAYLDAGDVDYQKGMNIYNTWKDWLEAWQNKAHSEAYDEMSFLDTAIITDNGAFQYFFLQEQITKEAITGIVLSLALAYIVLCAATMNWIISLYCILTIAILVLGVISFTVWNGWKLGVIESVIYVMVVGLSVDYTVHLSEAYLASGKEKREDRCQVMLYRMGISIISGAVSTLGAAFFLLLATVIFFSKFGSIIFFLIFQSAFVSLAGFSALLDTFGPQVPQLGENIKRHVEVLVQMPDGTFSSGYVEQIVDEKTCKVLFDDTKEEKDVLIWSTKRKYEDGSLHFVEHLWSAIYKFFHRMWKGYQDWYSSDLSQYDQLMEQNALLNEKLDDLNSKLDTLMAEKNFNGVAPKTS
eukprot:CAMPEP_0117786428 /NCGR_PEP_ID=MMETSP0948-20121206/5828_1 /TAXON_ID=44440 /ORGANISM="Chattonella subsalsa, Strain CCMP2191" /LENGTH=1226 /DNA_ID=CAMNT_0005615433 /DNA_START=52 /DNA_END=3732 /DNA_ORIENTATION=-